jgi:hypothetical protein
LGAVQAGGEYRDEAVCLPEAGESAECSLRVTGRGVDQDPGHARFAVGGFGCVEALAQ